MRLPVENKFRISFMIYYFLARLKPRKIQNMTKYNKLLTALI